MDGDGLEVDRSTVGSVARARGGYGGRYRGPTTLCRKGASAHLLIQGDGRGFAPDDVNDTVRLVGNRERLELLDGTIEAESTSGGTDDRWRVSAGTRPRGGLAASRLPRRGFADLPHEHPCPPSRQIVRLRRTWACADLVRGQVERA
jgi:hypothetical protein